MVGVARDQGGSYPALKGRRKIHVDRRIIYVASKLKAD